MYWKNYNEMKIKKNADDDKKRDLEYRPGEICCWGPRHTSTVARAPEYIQYEVSVRLHYARQNK